MAKALSEARWPNSTRGTYERKMTMRTESGRVSYDDLEPKPKPNTLSFWYTGKKGCLYIREQGLQD